MWGDFKYAARMLIKSPAFSLVAIITLALGIGANTAIFSVVEGTLLRPLPFANANRLVRLYEATDDNGARGSLSISANKRSDSGANLVVIFLKASPQLPERT
jgi:hypothetical protein